jgi:single-stranded-DNA-specific exonuclease
LPSLVTHWEPAPENAVARELVAAGYSPRLAALLAHRGLNDAPSARRFLDPSPDDLHSPFDLLGLEAAVVRLLAARDGGERVALIGDYDVDGVAGTALLSVSLESAGLEVVRLIPDRMAEGYGFQPIHVERACAMGCRLAVTVDCGSTSAAALEEARRAGLDVIVTDHHLPPDDFPSDVIQINPRQIGCHYPFSELSGAGLALKLSIGLLTRAGGRPPLEALLRIASLGTIADLVPLVGENRVIAALGLSSLHRTRSLGLRALMRISGVKAPLRADDVGYRLGPRLNAAGRLATASAALELLLTRDAATAERLAEELDHHNRERQAAERAVVQEAGDMLAERRPIPGLLVAWSEGWHRGVVGIAAGRLASAYHRPVVLFACDGSMAVGSGRSIAGIHLHGFLSRWRERLTRFGGHAAAIGLSVETAQLDGLRSEWEEHAVWPAETLVRRYHYELDLESAGAIDQALYADIRRLEPFGMGNAAPLVRLRGLRLFGAPRLFGNEHLSAVVHSGDGQRARIVGWGWARRRAELEVDAFDLLATVEWDDWMGAPCLRLVDTRPSASGAS